VGGDEPLQLLDHWIGDPSMDQITWPFTWRETRVPLSKGHYASSASTL